MTWDTRQMHFIHLVADFGNIAFITAATLNLLYVLSNKIHHSRSSSREVNKNIWLPLSNTKNWQQSSGLGRMAIWLHLIRLLLDSIYFVLSLLTQHPSPVRNCSLCATIVEDCTATGIWNRGGKIKVSGRHPASWPLKFGLPEKITPNDVTI